jgi:heme exporter protein B
LSLPVLASVRLAAKDLTLEARTRELLDAALLGALAAAVVGGVALAAVPESAERTAAVLWTGAVIASLVPLARSFTGEADRGTLDILLLLPVDRGAILLGKVLSNLVLTLAAVAVLLAAYVLLFGTDPGALGTWANLAVVVLLGCVGLSAVGSTLAAIASQARSREALLPVLLLPLLLPVLLSGIPASIHALRGDALGAFAGELQLLLGYDLLFLAASWALFEFIVEA